ncbi:MAG: dockerin type I repeat-containing protein [Candidatus Zixiibacteriota bacterium]
MDPDGVDISTDPRGQGSPCCASDGQNFMVSFNTHRCDSAYTDIYVARVNANGSVTDPNGFAVCTDSGDQTNSRVAHGITGYMVTWQDDRNLDSLGYDVYGTKVTSDGTVSNPNGRRISHARSSETSPALAWGGDSFLTVWQDGNPGADLDVAGMRIDALGQGLESNSFVVSKACGAQVSGSSAWSGSSYLAVWEGDGHIFGTRVDRFGNVLDTASLRICSTSADQKHPALAWGKDSFLAVWEDFRNRNFDIFGARIDSSGEILDTLGLPIREESSFDERYPDIAWDGGNYLVAWQKMLDSTGANCRIEAQRFSSFGVPIDPQPMTVSPGDKGSYPRVAYGGGKYLVVWLDADYYDIYDAIVDTNGTVHAPTGIRVLSGIQQSPAVASNGSGFLVVWEDYGSNWPDADILATRVTASGVVQDPLGIEIAASADAELVPSVTFDGRNYVVVWRRTVGAGGAIYASRVTPQGLVLDPDGTYISDISPYSGTLISTGPAAAGSPSGSKQSLMLYSRYQTDPYNSLRIFGALFWGESQPNFPPGAFSLVSPIDKDTVARPVLLDWEDAIDPNPSDQVTYTVLVSSSPHFVADSTQTFDGLGASQTLVTPQTNSAVYWWKVKAQDKWGSERWSNQTYSFDVEDYGDVNGDGKIDAGDVVFLINYLFRAGPFPQPLAAGDSNGDCKVDTGDLVYLVNYLFRGGPHPVRGCA